MDTIPNSLLPIWASRVTQQEIRRFYETDAKGIYDEELINDVGFGLLARCSSFIDAVEAVRGRARCLKCSTIIEHSCRKDEVLRCKCGWELPWIDYFKTIQHKQLSGAEPVLEQFQSFVQEFKIAHTAKEKTILIDRLLHGFHWYLKTKKPTRPVAINLIEGRLEEVVAFLDNLSSSEKSTMGVAENYVEWRKNIG